ncbi:DUF1289 domain-containing protein [Litorimonas sp. RW-G-Af-16]
MLSQTPTIQSPCKLICEMDLTSALCKGCGRTREEIATWSRMTPAKRAFIMTELEDRMAELDK